MRGNRIKNEHYIEFLDKGIITPIGVNEIKQALININNFEKKNKNEARALLILSYLTGARPNEVLQVKGKDILEEGRFITAQMKGSKGGLPRKLYFQKSSPLVQEFYNFALANHPEMPLFFHFISRRYETYVTKKGVVKHNLVITKRLYHHFKQWFKGVLPDSISPYYLRHNRFSSLMESGADLQELRLMKGSKTFESITPYLHMSSKLGKKLAKRIR